MPAQIFGAEAAVSILNRAFTNTSPANAVFANQVKSAAGSLKAGDSASDVLSYVTFAKDFGKNYATQTPEALAKLLLTNMGVLPSTVTAVTALEPALAKYIEANGVGNIGIIALQLGNIFTTLETATGDLAVYNAASKAWNEEVTTAFIYSNNPVNTTASSANETGNEAAKSLVLTVNQDVLNGGAAKDVFRGVAGAPIGAQDQTTLNSSDILDGGKEADQLIVNMTGGNYAGGARIKNIELVTIGSNQAAAAFDFNVNEGSNEVEGVATIEYDQINTGEALTVNNILKQTVVTVGADGKETSATAIPTLLWDNEAGSGAGVINANFRASAVAGATELNVQLDDVAAGNMNIGGGVETIVITSQGSTRNTLNASANVDGNVADIVSGSNDGVNDNGALTKVVVKGAQAFGQAPGVATNDTAANNIFGLTNHVVNTDLGNNNLTGSSNLSSVAATVTEIDASAADGGVAMTFVARGGGDTTPVSQKFTGGKAADFIVFQRGNVNAAGGEGADTFAFLNPGLTNFDFGSADSIVGGTGADTIMLGLNGVGVVVANTTEFNNKTGIETLDLRGLTNTVTLADAFVAAADVGTFTVRTDRIVQASDTSTANTTPSNAANNAALENNTINTIVLTELADNRAIEFIGGSGSDRVVVNNASANAATKLDGGTNAATGFNDSLTVVNTAVLDANDVANIKNFEFINLVETTTTNTAINLALSEAFVLANTNGLVIGSTTGTYGNRLGAGDVVNLEISDLLNNGVAKTSLTSGTPRTVNVQDLIAAGVTVNFQINGVTSTTNAVPAALAAVLVSGTAPAPTIIDDVAGAALAPTPFTGTVTGANGSTSMTTAGDTVTANSAVTLDTLAGNDTVTVNGTNGQVANITLGDGNDTVTLNKPWNATDVFAFGAGTDTLNLQADNGNTALAESGLEILNINAAQTTDLTLNQGSALTVNASAAVSATASAAGDVLTFTGSGTGTQSIAANAGNDSLSSSTTGAVHFTTGDGTNTVNLSGTGVKSVTGGTGVDTMTLTGGGTYNVTAGDGADVITVAAAGATITSIDAGAGADTVILQAGALAAASRVATGAGADTLNVTGVTGALRIDTGGSAGSSATGFDVVTGFNTANMTFGGSTATEVNSRTIASSTTATLAGDLNTAITFGGGAAANFSEAGDVMVYTVTNFNGTGPATFLAINLATSGFDNGDVLIQLVGLTGTVTTANFV